MSAATRQTTKAAADLMDALRDALLGRESIPAQGSVHSLFQGPDLPMSLWGCAAMLYQPATPRILVVRATHPTAFENVRAAINQMLRHGRFNEFAIHDWNRCRMQVDFIIDEPESIKLSELSNAVLPDGRVKRQEQVVNGMDLAAPWQVQVVSTWPEVTMQKLTRFELGVDGLRIVKEGKRRYFLPGDAFVHSILGIGQLRRHIQRLFPGDDIEQLTYYRFRSLSFVSGVTHSTADRGRDATALYDDASADREPRLWLPLYRGMPPVPEVNEQSLSQAARAGTRWIADNLQPDGRFVYYYDAATDTPMTLR